MLKLKSLTTPSTVLAAIFLAAAPSVAQERYHGRQNPVSQESGCFVGRCISGDTHTHTHTHTHILD